MTTILRFLHTMHEAAFLEQALKDGLMLTDHPVKFAPLDINDGGAIEIMQSYSIAALNERASALGVSDLNLNALMYGLGTIAGKIPMICFTEVHEGRSLVPHYANFGAYGVVVSKEWLEANGGDRVLYAGPTSAVTKRLHRLFVDLQIAKLYVQNGKMLFNNSSLEPILNLLAYIQSKDQLDEVEWRIAGEHGFTGRRRETGDRLTLPFDAIQAVLVKKEDEVEKFTDILKALSTTPGKELPPVLVQPRILPLDIGDVSPAFQYFLSGGDEDKPFNIKND